MQTRRQFQSRIQPHKPRSFPTLERRAVTLPMQYYQMWCNLRESRRDLEFCKNVDAYLGHLQKNGRIEGWRLTRRKFGFGPDGLGEFNITVWTKDLAQLDHAFSLVATRDGEVERLHHPVYSMVTDFKSALYRDFPDPERTGP